MTKRGEVQSGTRCPRCGKLSTGVFCTECGARLQPTGNPAKLVAAAVGLVLIAFVAGQAVGRRSVKADAGVAQQSEAVGPSGALPNLANVSPEERASRLFNRVMAYSEQGKLDSARFFAPMAIQAYQTMGPLNAHSRYDIGAIAAAIGEVAMARLEADTILASQPNHLLGLALAMRAAAMAGDSAAANRFQRRLVAAEKTERAKGLEEYAEHAREIDNALKKPGASPSPLRD